MQYAMDICYLQGNGAETIMPAYHIIGEDVSLEKEASIKIRSQYLLPIKISSILRKKLGISQREFHALFLNNRIHSNTEQDLRRCKLSSAETIITISK